MSWIYQQRDMNNHLTFCFCYRPSIGKELLSVVKTTLYPTIHTRYWFTFCNSVEFTLKPDSIMYTFSLCNFNGPWLGFQSALSQLRVIYTSMKLKGSEPFTNYSLLTDCISRFSTPECANSFNCAEYVI